MIRFRVNIRIHNRAAMRQAILLLAFVLAPCAAQQPNAPDAATTTDPWFGTFSIIAFDPATNELGVGVQSRAFGAGAAVPYAKPGVGAVATQASANRQYGPKAIALLEQGLPVEEVVKRITDEDAGRDTRQVAVIDAKGRSAVYTGRNVIDRNSDPKDPVHYGGYAGHVSGPNFSVQGNTLASVEVVKAMAAAYEQGKGSMAERLMDALDAGQSKGGDTRGMQSAGILVVRPLAAGSNNTVERIVDIRVDDHENPFKELRRLLYMTTGVIQRRQETASEARRAKASSPRRSPSCKRRSRSTRAVSSCTTRWRSATRRPATRRTRFMWLGTAISAPAARVEAAGGRGSALLRNCATRRNSRDLVSQCEHDLGAWHRVGARAVPGTDWCLEDLNHAETIAAIAIRPARQQRQRRSRQRAAGQRPPMTPEQQAAADAKRKRR